jgi:argininosuccinate synthase
VPLLTAVRAGNDQIRFDLIFRYRPEIEIITPIRDLKLSRQEEVDYLSKTECNSWKSPIFD